MVQKSSRSKTLEVFFSHPQKRYYIREISRLITLAPPSIRKYINEFLEENIILKDSDGIYTSYKANRYSEEFRFQKRLNTITLLKESGLIQHISESCLPNVIILFGSASKGEDIETSDIDLYVQSKEISLDLSTFEAQLKRKIRIFFESDFNTLSSELQNNIINGIVLEGYLKVK